MRLSKRSEYGIRALIGLAFIYGQGPVHIEDIADREKIPVKFLQQVLLTLKHAGILHSRRGANGGYYLARAPEGITLGELIRVLDGTLAPVPCVSEIAYERCNRPGGEEKCGLRIIMSEVRDAIAGILDHTTLADVCAHAVKPLESET
jgi:Rrf2 family protein